VPGTDAAWSSAPFEAQYLKLYDVTTPPAVSATPTVQPAFTVPGSSSSFTSDGTTRLSWNAVTDAEGLSPVYQVTARNSSGTVVATAQVSSNSTTMTGLTAGNNYTFTVTALNPNDTSMAAAASGASASLVSLNPTADDDGDGMSNAAELVAGTNPQSASSNFVASASRPTANSVTITWTPIAGRTYRVEATTSLSSPTWTPIAAAQTSGSYTENSVTSTARFYRVVVE
jgi:hypothetical protein